MNIELRLFTAVRPLWRYCLIAAPIALVPSVLLFASAFGVLRLLGVDPQQFLPSALQPTAREFFSAVLLSPAIETLLLAGLIAALLRMGLRPSVVASVSAIVWGGLHALLGPLWFFGTVWSFFVFSCAYIAWRRISFGRAYVAASVPHALVNLIAFGFSAWG